MSSLWYDILALIGSLTMLFAYARYMSWRSRKNPGYTIHGVTRAARVRWVEAVMASGKHDVLAVQTLRNSVMAASFMASTSVLLMIGVLSLSGSSDRSTSIWHALNVGTIEPQALALKLVLLLGDFFVAFFGFSMAVRFYNHVGYMINVPPSPEAARSCRRCAFSSFFAFRSSSRCRFSCW